MPRYLKALVGLVVLVSQPASACTAQELKEKGAIAWDRAALFSLADLEGGRALQQRMLATQLAADDSEIARGRLCALYEEVTKTANNSLGNARRRPWLGGLRHVYERR